MSDRTPSPVDAHVVRVRRVLDEALDRFVGRDEDERSDALLTALRSEVSALPPTVRDEVLAALAAVHAEPVARAVPGGDEDARRRLEEENERLREALAAAQAAPARPAPEVRTGGDDLVRILVGPARRAGAPTAAGADERAVVVLRAMVDFVAVIARSFLSVGVDPDKTMAGHFHGVIADEIDGKRPTGNVKKLFDQMRIQIGNQVLAFRGACDAGARHLLRQLDPETIQAAAEGGRWSIGQGKYWEAFLARYEELQRSDDLFKEYFEVAWKRITQEQLRRASRDEEAP